MRARVVSALLERRIPQVAGVYLATSWALLEFLSWAAERGHVPAAVPDRVLAVLALLLPAALLVAWRLGATGAGGTAPGVDVTTPAAAPVPRSVAVLPLENLSASPADAYLGEAISDEILTALAKVEGLRVASRTSSFAAARDRRDPREIGRSLGVGAVLEGSVQRAGERLRVSTRLASAADGFGLWSARWDADMPDLFRIEDEITAGVVGALRVLLKEAPVRSLAVPRTDIRAYEHYLRGRQYFYQTRLRSLRFARQMFERAIDVDPDYALAHAALADAIALERMYYPAAEVDLARADRASLRALALDPDRAEVHASRGLTLFTMRRPEEAEDEFREALRLDARLFDAHYFLARMYMQAGRLEEAAGSFETAASLREDYQAAFFAAQALEALGRTPQALDHYRTALVTAESHMELNPDDARAATMRGVALCRIGRVAEGLEWARQAVELDPADGGVRYNVACLHAVAGEGERAIEQLEGAVAAGFGNRDWLMQDPDLSSIRTDPRVQALMNRM